jgi:hypothetical protein
VLRAADVLGDSVVRAVLDVATTIERDVRSRLGEVLRPGTATTEGPVLAERLAAVLRDLGGLEVLDLVVSPARLAALTGASRPTGEVARVMARWRRSNGLPAATTVGASTFVPLRREGRLLGVLRYAPGRQPVWGIDVEAVVASVAEDLVTLLCDVERREEASLTERRFAELDAWRAQLNEVAFASRTRAAQSPAAAGGALDAVLEALERPVRDDHASLARVLPNLVRQIVSPEVDVSVRVTGVSGSLPVRIEVLVVGLVEELVRVLLPRSRASRLVVELRCPGDRVDLTVQDDGLPLSHRASATTRLFERLRALAVRCDAEGGALEASNLSPLGVQITATVPVAPPRPAAARHQTTQEEAP